jgi:hypothetical protein
LEFDVVRIRSFVAVLVLSILPVLGLSKCQRAFESTKFTEAEIDQFAADMHVTIGGERISIPYIALSGLLFEKQSFGFNKQEDRKAAANQREDFLKRASSPESNFRLNTLEFNLRVYGWNDGGKSLDGLCTKLRRQWAKSICDDPWSPLLQSMPHDNNQMYLVDADAFHAFKHHWTVGGETKFDQLSQMKLNAGDPAVVCDKKIQYKNRFCTAAVLVKGRLAVVWTVWDSKAESPRERAKREARAIVALVSNGFGPKENFAPILKAACDSVEPGAPAGIKASPCFERQ